MKSGLLKDAIAFFTPAEYAALAVAGLMTEEQDYWFLCLH
jgi:hypothetical protein